MSFYERAAYWSGVAVWVFGILAAVAAVAAWHFSNRVADAKDAELQGFQRRSASDIAAAHSSAAQANARAAEADERAAKANERAVEVARQAAGLNDRAAGAELELEKLRYFQKQQESRLLKLNGDERLFAFARVLQKLQGKKAIIWYAPEDMEASMLAHQLYAGFFHAKWEVEG